MRVIGLTGGIATGKSTAAAMLAELGAVVIDADQVARRVVEPGEPALEAIVEIFGSEVLTPDGRLDRQALARRVFKDEGARQQLNAVTHPAVIKRFRQRLTELKEREPEERPAAAVLDVPLLFEAGMDEMCDEVWVVAASAETQKQRLCERDGLSPEEAKARMESQMPLSEKIQRADVVIDNSGSREETRRQVEAAWQQSVWGTD